MSREPVSCTIPDDDGEPHQYMIIPHKAADGLAIGPRLVALAGPALAGLIGKAMAGGVDLETDVDLGAAVSAFAGALVREDVGALAKRLLASTTRDGKPLGNPAMFEEAFIANYGELGEALAKVIEVNRFALFFKRIASRGLGGGERLNFLPQP